MTESTLHEIAAAAASLNPKPYEKIAAVDRLVADGRAEYVSAFEFRLTQKGLEWLGRIG